MEEAYKNHPTPHLYFHGQTKISLPKSHGQGTRISGRSKKKQIE